ncbi:MAG TPA: TonB-dependent receptor, partial [Ignavibacteriaceae bacterium]|nr:TonB-dependent receptor [Ignavibacteriaceae bacterium]
NPSSSNSIYDGRKMKFDFQNTLNLGKPLSLTLGVENEKETALSDYFIFSQYGNFVSTFPLKSAITNGIFIEDQSNISDLFFFNLGIRYDHHNKFGNALTYRIAPAFIIWETGTKLKATYGTGFKTPSLFYLFDPSFGNENLKPEKSTGWDAGIEQFLFDNDLSAGVTYFRNTFDDLFGFDQNFKTINVDKSESYGLEFYVTVVPLQRLKIKSNYTYTKTKDLSDNSPDKNLPLLRRPVHKGVLSANYSFLQKFNANLEIIFVGKRDDKYFNGTQSERIQLNTYTLINFAASYDVFNYLELHASVNNVLDTYYEEVYGYATPRLSVYGGFKIKI